jgi:hypothetical protein
MSPNAKTWQERTKGWIKVEKARIETRFGPVYLEYQALVREFPDAIRNLETSPFPREWIESEARELFQNVRRCRHSVAQLCRFHRRAPKQLRKLLKRSAPFASALA